MVEYDYEQINKQELIWEDNNMSRLGMLYALNEEDVKKLRSVPEEERYSRCDGFTSQCGLSEAR